MRLILILAALCIGLGARAQEPYKTSDEAAAAIRQNIGQVEARNSCMADAHKENDQNNAAILKQNRKIYALCMERDKVLDEYRRGEFCSGCGQTRSQIEAKREQFPHPGQHIIPATQEQINSKEQEYHDKINQLVQENAQNTKTYQGILARWTKCRDEKVIAEAAVINAQYWTEVLSQREDAERKRKAAEELQRKMQEKLEAERQKRELEMEQARLRAQALQEEKRAQAQEQLQHLKERMEANARRLQEALSQLGALNRGDSQVVTPPLDEDNTQINVGSLGGSYDDGTDDGSRKGWLNRIGAKLKDTLPDVVTSKLPSSLQDLLAAPSTDEAVNSGLSLIGKDLPESWGEWAAERAQKTMESRIISGIRNFFKPAIRDNVYDLMASEKLDEETKDIFDTIGVQENAWNEFDYVRGKKNVWQKIWKGKSLLSKGLNKLIEERMKLLAGDIDRVQNTDDN